MPVLDDDGTVVALVAAGVTVDSVSAALGQRLPLLVGGALATVALGALAAWLLSRHLRRVTRGLGAEELGRVSDHHEAVLHSVGEGLVLVDDQGRLTLANDHAALLLGLPSLVDDVARRPVPVAELAAADVARRAARRWRRGPGRGARRRRPGARREPAGRRRAGGRRRGRGGTVGSQQEARVGTAQEARVDASAPSPPCETTPSCGS